MQHLLDIVYQELSSRVGVYNPGETSKDENQVIWSDITD
jgi:hypothetical protein